MCHVAFVIVELRESAHDAVDGSHRWPRNVRYSVCYYEAGHVAFWLRLLKNSKGGSDRAIMESVAAPVRIFVAPVDVPANQSCASDLPK